MPLGYEALLNDPPAIADGSPLANSTTLTDISPAPQASLLVGPNGHNLRLGQSLHIVARCKFSNITTAPSLLLGIYYGGVAGIKLCAIGATATTLTAASWPIHVEAWLTCRALGSGTSGSIIAFGFVDLGTSLTAVTRIPMDASAIAAVGVDTTAAKIITLGAQWSAGSAPSASDTITCNEFLIESLN